MSETSKQAYRIPAFCAAYGIGRSKAYEEIAAGRLKATKVGRVTLITRFDAEVWLQAYRRLSDAA